MKFAHLSDCHIGGWRDELLKELSIKAFEEAIKICIKEHTAFVLIAGDLFDTSLPNIDIIKRVAAALNKLKENDISVYLIPGSHDYSPSGKTMLDVLEKSGLVENVFKFNEGKLEFTIDKTNTKITGVHGLRTGLDRNIYAQIKNRAELEKESGFKIFMFHCLLSEFSFGRLVIVQPPVIRTVSFCNNFFSISYFFGFKFIWQIFIIPPLRDKLYSFKHFMSIPCDFIISQIFSAL